MNSHETNENGSPQNRVLTQEKLMNESSFTRQLEDLTRLVQIMTTASHLNYYPKAGNSAGYSAPR